MTREYLCLSKHRIRSSGEFQDVLTKDGRPVYELVADKVNEWGADSMDGDYSNVGAVAGATYPEQGRILEKAYAARIYTCAGIRSAGREG